MRDVVLPEKQIDLFDALLESRNGLIGRYPEAPELVRKKGTRESDIEPAMREGIEHPNFTGELERVIKDGQNRARYKTHVFRALSSRGEKHDWTRAVAAVRREVVLYGADVGVAKLVCGF